MSRTSGQSAENTYWRSLEDFAQTPQFRAWAEREFPAALFELDCVAPSRRRFLQLMAGSLALAGMAAMGGCRRPAYKFLPRNSKAAEEVPGRPMYFATTMVLAGDPIGLLVETNDGRPTKIEGNPLHPASMGAAHIWAQASILDLYNPSRSRSFRNRDQIVSRQQFIERLDKLAADLKSSGGDGLAILSEDYASPAIEMLLEHIRRVLPRATFHVYEPTRPLDNAAEPIYSLDQADVILSLDCDFLGTEDQAIRYKRDFASARQADQGRMNRLYVVEPCLTVTGMAADHRLRRPASEISEIARQLLEGSSNDPWVAAAIEDLHLHPGRSAVITGVRHPELRQIVDQINSRLGNTGKTVFFSARPRVPGLLELVDRIHAERVNLLLILGGNPVFNAPADLEFAQVMKKVAVSIHLSVEDNETSAVATWHAPAVHWLESWGDARAADGTLSPIQPMIEPLFGGMSPLEVLARIGSYDLTDPEQIVRRSFARIAGDDDLEKKWRQYLHEGVFQTTTLRLSRSVPPPPSLPPATELSAENLEVCFATDASVFDGRFADNAWLQECPDPITKLTWDNAALLSPKTAGELAVNTCDVVRIELAGRAIEIPAMIVPGLADYSITLPLGYGRSRCGPIGTGAGANAYAIRTTGAMGFAIGARLYKTGKTCKLATTQDHWSVAEHHLVSSALGQRAIIREESLHHPEAPHSPHPAQDIHTPPADLNGGLHQWGMVIDLTTCIGCSACVVACQAENNIPVVGKDEVLRGREMHWIRLDRYFSGKDPSGDVKVVTQPMLCQHCENAPCEPVCPVNASVHDDEGLNVQVYNRCIGTRYCANNCPYKVRRFNFYDYNKGTLRVFAEDLRDGNPAPDPRKGYSLPQLAQPPIEELLKMQKNPNVTVRMRGVMEKCTFCIQRIREAHHEATIAAGNGPRQKIADGQVVPACAQTCPTQAIVFGDISDPNSCVSRAKASGRNYLVLEHLNTRPRTTYLSRVRNPNTKLVDQA